MMSAPTEDKSVQTDEDLIYNYAWTKFYYHFQSHANAQNQVKESTKVDIRPSEAGKLDADEIKKIAEENLEARGLLYEPSTGLYYDSHNDLFYDQDTQFYLDIVNRINYKYILNERTNSYQLRYHSKMDRSLCKRLRNYLKRSDLFDVEGASSSLTSPAQGRREEGEELDSSSDSSEWSSSSSQRKKHHKKRKKKSKKKHRKKSHNRSPRGSTSENPGSNRNEGDDDAVEIVDFANKYPPCIRAIFIETDLDEDEIGETKLGSLFLVPYTGGSIGRASKCVISFPKSKQIENEHVKIEYDVKKKVYTVKDLNSKIGSYLNETRLEPETTVEINHGDRLKLGNLITLLIHIHNGTNSCVNCEPGEVMSRLKQEKDRLAKEASHLSLEEARKETLKKIKKKYGLKYNDFDMKMASNDSNKKYKNRAAERRNQFGIDTSHLPGAGESRASVEVAIGEENLGRKMLEKMGWKHGQGLGKNEEGITEPISTVVKLDNSGLGSSKDATGCSMDMSESQKRKLIAIKKTQERFQAASNP